MGKRLPSVSLSAWRGLSDSVYTVLNQHRKSLKALHSIVKYYQDHPRHEAIFIKQKTGMHVVHEYTHHWFSKSSMTWLAGWHSNSGEFEMKDMWLPPSGLKQSASQSSSFILFFPLSHLPEFRVQLDDWHSQGTRGFVCTHSDSPPLLSPEGSISTLKPNTLCNSFQSVIKQFCMTASLRHQTLIYMYMWLVCIPVHSQYLSLHPKRCRWHPENGHVKKSNSCEIVRV